MASAADIKAGRAFVELYLKDNALTKGLKASSDKLKSFGKGIGLIGAAIAGAGAAITGPILLAVHKFAEGGDQLAKMSQRTGVSAKALSELGFAASQSGVDIETLETQLIKMQKAIGGALTGNGESAKALHVLGIGLDQLKGKSPDKQLEIIADAISKIKDPAIRNRRLIDLLGKSGAAMAPLLAKGAAGIRALREEAQDLGLSKSEEDVKLAEKLQDAFHKMGNVISGVWSKIGGAVAGTVLQGVEWITRIVSAAGKWIKQNKGLFDSIFRIGAALTVVGTAIGVVGTSIALAGVVLGGLATGLGVIGSILGTILSPLGLITVALAAGGYVWANYTASGQAAMTAISDVLSKLLATFKATFGGISDAIKGGDLALAGSIAIAGLQVALLQGITAIAEAVGGAWGEFVGKLGSQLAEGDIAGAWSTAIEGMGALWDAFCGAVVSAFTKAADAVVGAWKKATTAIANFLLEDAANGGILGSAALLGTGVDMKTEEGKKKLLRMQDRMAKTRQLEEEQGNLEKANANGGTMTDEAGQTWTSGDIQRRIDELKQQIGVLNGAQTSFLDDAKKDATAQISDTADSIHAALAEYDKAAQEQAERSKEALAGGSAGGSSASHEALDAAQAKLDALLKQAADARAAQEEKDKAREDALSGSGRGEAEANLGKEVVGSFSAAALAAGGATSSPAERAAKAAEKQNELTGVLIGQGTKNSKFVQDTLTELRNGAVAT